MDYERGLAERGAGTSAQVRELTTPHLFIFGPTGVRTEGFYRCQPSFDSGERVTLAPRESGCGVVHLASGVVIQKDV